jgi:response regulator NasT
MVAINLSGKVYQHVDRELSRSTNPEEVGKRDLSGKRAVVAEDQGVTQIQLQRILRSEGIEVVGTAANGQEAIDVVSKTQPDIVLMDIQMPVMDGMEASRRILKDFQVCIVMLTASAELEHQLAAQEIGACGYVSKPVTAVSLVPQIAEAYERFRRQ